MRSRIKDYDEDEILAQINIIPLVDVSLVLLIIFIITISRILTPSLNIMLPQAAHANSYADLENINVSISGEGIVYLEGDVVKLKDFKPRLEELHLAEPERGVIVNVDKSVNFQRVVNILDVIGNVGITKLDIMTVKD